MHLSIDLINLSYFKVSIYQLPQFTFDCKDEVVEQKFARLISKKH